MNFTKCRTIFFQVILGSCLILPVLLTGCTNYTTIQLDDCKIQDTKKFVEKFPSAPSKNLRYHYTMNHGNKHLVFNGVSHKKADDIYLAGFSDSGITLFSAKWNREGFTILKNNIKMPEFFLKEAILTDLLLPWFQPSKESDCIFQNPVDQSDWLVMDADFPASNCFYVITQNQTQWCRLNRGQLVYQAQTWPAENSEYEEVDISNFKLRYTAVMKLLKSSPRG